MLAAGAPTVDSGKRVVKTAKEKCSRRLGDRMARKQWFGVLCALAAVAAGCGRSSSTTTDATTAAATTVAAAVATTAAPATTAGAVTPAVTDAPAPTEAPTTTKPDPCAAAKLEATDTGISAEKITVLVMADVGSELAPGLFQGSIDGTKAWAKAVNANGGLACRQIEVLEWDSKINPTEGTNGYLEACSKAVAMVGSTTLFIPPEGIASLETCPNAKGEAVGFADIPERAVDAVQQCSTHVFTLAGINGSCPYSGAGTRDYLSFVGPFKKYTEIAGGPLHGIYLIPSDLPSTIASSMPTIRGLNQAGLVKSDAEFGVSGGAAQAAFAEYVAAMKTNNSNIAIDGSNDQAMIKLRTEAKAQGLDDSKVVWACSLACYTDAFRKDPNVDGTYLWLPFLPFEERDQNADLDAFLTGIGSDFPQSWSVLAWNSGRVFEQAVNAIVAVDGPNGITRARILEELPKLTAFDNGGWLGAVDLSKKTLSSCFVMLQLKGGKYERIYPTEKGKLDCTTDNAISWSGDSANEYKG